MKIGIYYCKFGAGHHAAARYLSQLLEKDYEVQLNDLYETVWPGASEIIYASYRRLIQSDSVLDYLGKVTKESSSKPHYLPLVESKVFKTFDKQAAEGKLPQVFIATYSMAAYFLARYKELTQAPQALITCITDFNVHRFWVNPQTDLYIVPSQHTKEQLCGFGVNADKILVFSPVPSHRRSQDQDNSGGRVRILISGGGLGLLPKRAGFYRRLVRRLHAELRIICAHNDELRFKLLAARLPHTEIYGYVSDMETHLSWADCCITKPGGLSLMEAIEHETPLLYLNPKLPQERGNAVFIEKAQIGFALNNADELKALKKRKHNHLKTLQENIRQIKREQSPEINQSLAELIGDSQISWPIYQAKSGHSKEC